MAMIPPIVPVGIGGTTAGSIGIAGGTAGTASYPSFPSVGGVSSMPDLGMGSGSAGSDSGFVYQGKAYDPILNEPMVVSAETHADFWEDDMDYSESVNYEGIDTKTKTQSKTNAQSKTDEKTCENCPPEGKVLPMVRRCSRWSLVTISYQTRICGTFYDPVSQQIQEFKYCGVSFDGWKDKLCQFWEAKARYDQFFISSTMKKKWWRGDKSAINQAGRHQAVATANPPLKVVWFFMQPISYAYFLNAFEEMSEIIVRYQP